MIEGQRKLYVFWQLQENVRDSQGNKLELKRGGKGTEHYESTIERWPQKTTFSCCLQIQYIDLTLIYSLFVFFLFKGVLSYTVSWYSEMFSNKQQMDLCLPSGLMKSLKVGKEMKVWDTECVGSRTQATSLGWQDFMQRMVSERSSLTNLQETTGHTQPTKKKKKEIENTKPHTWPLTFR